MKNFIPASIENFPAIQEELAQKFFSIIGATDSDSATSLLKEGVRTYGTIPNTPLFSNYIKGLEQYGKVLNMTFWVTGSFTKNKPHIDGTSTFVPKIKLIMPILNCKNTITRWFNYTGDTKLITKNTLELFAPEDTNLLEFDQDLEMLEPIWARVDRFHTIMNFNIPVRVACSIVFENQELLYEDFINDNPSL